MSDSDKPDDKAEAPRSQPPASHHPPRGPSAGRSGTAGSIGAELGDLDFEPDALLDSLMTEDDALPGRPTPSPALPSPQPPPALRSPQPPPALRSPQPPPAQSSPQPPPASVAGRKLHEPAERRFAIDDVTVVGSRDSLTDNDGAPTPARIALPPRPAGSPPRPPRPETTAKPPAVNPPGHPPREPFPVAASPEAPPADEVIAVSHGSPSISGVPTHPFIDESAVAATEDAAFEMLDSGTLSDRPPTTSSRPPLVSDDPILVDDDQADVDELLDGEFAEVADASHHTEDASEAPASVLPRPIPSRPPPPGAAWADERPAAAHLAERQWRDDWIARAERAEAEAQALADPQQRARALVVASELWALTGDSARAREIATEAVMAAASMPLAHRQLRWLAASEGDFGAVASSLETESRASPTAEARVHGAYLASELQRLVHHDDSLAQKKLEQASRALPADPRPHLAKLAQALAADAGVPKLRFPDAPAVAPVAAALAEINALRSGVAEGETSALVAFDQARRALAAGDTPRAGEFVKRLSSAEGLEEAACWLAASLLAASSATRPEAIELLRRILGRGRTAHVRRALAERALEQGDPEAVQAALEPDPSDEIDAFTAADRVALAALTGGGANAMRPLIAALAADETLLPLAAAAQARSAPADEPPTLVAGDEAARAEVTLGRTIAAKQADPSLLRFAVKTFSDSHPEHPLARMLGLEIALAERDPAAVAQLLAAWPRGEAGAEDERDRELAAALIRELGGDADGARRGYAAALRADAACEAAGRALLEAAPGAGAANILAGLAQATGDDAQRSILYVEAALRRGFDDVEHFGALLERAAEAAPGLPFAYRLGEQLARMRGDVGMLLAWLRRRRDAAGDPVEKALDLVREALLVADSDLELAASLVDDAALARPADVAVRALHDRLTPGPRVEKGTWREEIAGALDAAQRLPLLVEAALEFERAGDTESAARAALAAAELDRGGFARITAERIGGQVSGAARLAETLMEQAREEQDVIAQREIYQRLARLDEARGEQSSALLWQSAILEHSPDYLPALRVVEHAYISAGREDELEPIAAAIAARTAAGEANAHAVLAARIRSRQGNWAATRDLVDIAARHEPPSLWALRQLEAHGRVSGDDEAVYRADRALCDQATRAIDAATLALRAAETAARLSRIDDARALLERAVEMVPEHLVALTTRAEVLESVGDFAGAAESLEVLAAASSVPAHQLAARHHAATLWLDKVGNEERGLACLEEAAQTEGATDEIFSRLQGLLVARGDRAKLAELLERRIAMTTDPAERVALEVTRGRALADVGDRDAAKRALASALDANPDHADALDAFADLCAAEGDWQGAEQAWIRLARHVTEPERQAEIYRKLGELYDGQLENPARAELSYLEVLKRQPNDVSAMQRLVQVYGRLGQGPKAVELATALVDRAQSPEEKRDRMIALAQVYEVVLGDRRQAEATLDKARKAAPHDGQVLRALAGFHERNNETRALGVLLDRAAADARRALATGRFDASFFEVLGTVAELRGGADAAAVASATIAALDGREEVPVHGAGPAAGDPRLDELLAPDLLTLPLRALLRKAGDAFDAAYPVDLRGLRAAPLPTEAHQFQGQVQQLAGAFGINALQVFVSPGIGPSCMPVSSSPPQIVFGKELVENPDDAARYFLLVRTLKILQAHAATLSRTPPIELWPVMAAFLATFAPNWQPQGVDAKRFAEARQRIQPAISRNLDNDVPVLALEVIGSIGNRASQLATAINEWGNRAALLALGNPSAALRGVALAAGQDITEAGTERVKWIVRHPEARDLAVFSVSEQYAEARRRVGLGG